MQRYDLRHLKDNYSDRMLEIVASTAISEVTIFIIDFCKNYDNVTKALELLEKNGCTIMNSLSFSEVDWTIVVKRKV